MLSMAQTAVRPLGASAAPGRGGNPQAQAIPAPVIAESIQDAVLSDDASNRIGAVPVRPCSDRPRTILLGRPDDFAPSGSEPLFVSPTAKAVWGSRLVPFDYSGADRIFAVSINLGQCKLCGQRVINVEMKIRRNAGMAANDKAYLYLSNGTPNSSGLGPAVAVKDIWMGDPSTLLVKTITLQVPLAQANQYIFQNNMAFLDVVVQDDTAIDYVKVSW
jgi:hypothetical protein